MKLILWLVQLQWGMTLDRLTYEKQWSVERVSNLLVGFVNILLVTLALTHHSYWLMPLGLINSVLLISSISGFEILNQLLLNMGFKEKEQILKDLKIMVKAREANKKKMNEDIHLCLTSSANKVFIFDAFESQSVNQENENFLVFIYSENNTDTQTNTDAHQLTLTH
jgi:hypothetical protein